MLRGLIMCTYKLQIFVVLFALTLNASISWPCTSKEYKPLCKCLLNRVSAIDGFTDEASNAEYANDNCDRNTFCHDIVSPENCTNKVQKEKVRNKILQNCEGFSAECTTANAESIVSKLCEAHKNFCNFTEGSLSHMGSGAPNAAVSWPCTSKEYKPLCTCLLNKISAMDGFTDEASNVEYANDNCDRNIFCHDIISPENCTNKVQKEIYMNKLLQNCKGWSNECTRANVESYFSKLCEVHGNFCKFTEGSGPNMVFGAPKGSGRDVVFEDV